MRLGRSIVLSAGALAAVAAVAVFALLALGPSSTAHAEGLHGIQNLSCSVAPSPVSLDTPEVLSCTFDFQGNSHTFVADFQVSATAPHLKISSCTLDANPVHIGPCP